MATGVGDPMIKSWDDKLCSRISPPKPEQWTVGKWNKIYRNEIVNRMSKFIIHFFVIINTDHSKKICIGLDAVDFVRRECHRLVLQWISNIELIFWRFSVMTELAFPNRCDVLTRFVLTIPSPWKVKCTRWTIIPMIRLRTTPPASTKDIVGWRYH